MEKPIFPEIDIIAVVDNLQAGSKAASYIYYYGYTYTLNPKSLYHPRFNFIFHYLFVSMNLLVHFHGFQYGLGCRVWSSGSHLGRFPPLLKLQVTTDEQGNVWILRGKIH